MPLSGYTSCPATNTCYPGNESLRRVELCVVMFFLREKESDCFKTACRSFYSSNLTCCYKPSWRYSYCIQPGAWCSRSTDESKTRDVATGSTRCVPCEIRDQQRQLRR